MLKLFFYVLLVFLQTPVIQDINKDQVNSLINDKVMLIDLRTEKEFENGKIGSKSDFLTESDDFLMTSVYYLEHKST